jgi:hypothetical protein
VEACRSVASLSSSGHARKHPAQADLRDHAHRLFRVKDVLCILRARPPVELVRVGRAPWAWVPDCRRHLRAVRQGVPAGLHVVRGSVMFREVSKKDQ